MPVESVSSAKNPVIKEIRRAIARGTLTDDGLCIAESFHLLEEAIRSECEVGLVVTAESVRPTVEALVKGLKVKILRVPDELFRAIASTESPQGVLALVRPPHWDLEHLLRGKSLAVILDGIQDPGNAGAIIRSAEAFGATGLLFLKGSVNPYNPKTIRASAGSVFRIPVITGVDEDLALASLKHRRTDIYAAVAKGERALDEVDLTRRTALIIGSEGRGVRAKLRGQAMDLRIPTAAVESLNAAVAASILLYEASRQRRTQARATLE